MAAMGAIAYHRQGRILLLGALAALLVPATTQGESYALRESIRVGCATQIDSLSLILAEQTGQTVAAAQTSSAIAKAKVPLGKALRLEASAKGAETVKTEPYPSIND